MNLIYIYTHKGYNNLFLGKDVGMIPSSLARDTLVNSLFYNKSDCKRINFRNLKITFTGYGWVISNFYAIIFLWKNRNKKRDANLLIFHLSLRNIFPIFFYKLLYKGKIICKMDLNTETAKKYHSKWQGNFLKGLFMKTMTKLTDVFYVETRRNFRIIEKGIFGVNIKNKLKLLPNGVDIDLVNSVVNNNINEHKKKIITIISRYDSELKAPHRIFDVIEAMYELELHDWTFNIIGNFPSSFIDKITNLSNKNGIKIICTGENIELCEVYKHLYKSSIYLCLSKEESYCISLVESAIFNNYIISTDVGVAEDLSEQYNKIKIIEKYSNKTLKSTLNNIITQVKLDLSSTSNEMESIYSWINTVNRAESE